MKKFFSVCLTFLLFSCADSEPININELYVSEEKIDGNYRVRDFYYESDAQNKKSFSGEVIEYHEDGSFKSQYNVKQGKIIDKNIQSFYPNGSLRETQSIGENGYRVGLQERYYENGNLQQRMNFLPERGGIENLEFFYESGNLRRFISLIAFEGRIKKISYFEGKNESYYENGGIELVQHYRDGYLIKEEKYNSEQKKIHQLDYLVNNGQFQRFFEDDSKESIRLLEIWNPSIESNKSFSELKEKINSGGKIQRTTYDSSGNKVRAEYFELKDYRIDALSGDLTGSESDSFTLLFENNEVSDALCIFNGKETQDWFGKCQRKTYVTMSCESYPGSTSYLDAVGEYTHYQNLYLEIYLGSSNVENATYVYKNDKTNKVYREKGGVYKSRYEEYDMREMPEESLLRLQWGKTSNEFFLDRENPSKSYYWGLSKVPAPCVLIPAELMDVGIEKIEKIAEDTISENKF